MMFSIIASKVNSRDLVVQPTRADEAFICSA